MSQPSGPEHAFDFWIGEWDVFGPEGRQVGTSSITPLFGTGALAEHWRGAGGVEGRSLNAYDPADGRWHQTWLDSSGGVLFLEGAFAAGAMVLQGDAPGPDPDVSQPQRITWTPGSDGVRQHWETRVDGGEDPSGWTTVFDGRYPDAGGVSRAQSAAASSRSVSSRYGARSGGALESAPAMGLSMTSSTR